ncbi:DUF1345 domain-containing protein [Deinococcus radiomollis]|uniref:DUF1345 domain-containing protein n=1 Tax=Deinococcus radiomollis TaxID=468916 RepID=UPI00389136DF
MTSWLKEPSAVVRLGVAATIGVLVGIFLPPGSKWELHALAGWCASAVTFLLLAGWVFFTTDAENTRRLATREDDGRAVSSLLVLAGSLVSLGGVIYALTQVKELQKAGQATEATVLTALGLLSVALSWLLIQTVYAFRYAHLYFEEPEGGIDFQGDEPPDYLDFVYLAVTIGMTFQVSDTNLSQKTVRRSLTGHALIGYVYNTVLVALTINTVAGLLG